MKFKCPGSCNNSTPQLVIKVCPECGNEIEMFSIDMKATCDNCGFEAFNDIQSCIEWCQHAEECIGAELYRKLMAEKAAMGSRRLHNLRFRAPSDGLAIPLSGCRHRRELRYHHMNESIRDRLMPIPCVFCMENERVIDINNVNIPSNISYRQNHKTDSEVIEMKKWKCLVCGEIVMSDRRPDKCPVCKAPGEKFEEVIEGEMSWAAEHKVGIIDGVPQEIVDGLRANFNGECCEVGMYLAMSRVAFREGYPEIGMYWKQAAYEEADHAARFAEMLGEVVTPSTKKNLELRVAAENGATEGKTQLAKMAKDLNLDAIHDSVHEMARDEARHGKAFEGLLKRYFGE